MASTTCVLSLRIHDAPQLHQDIASEFGDDNVAFHAAGESLVPRFAGASVTVWPNSIALITVRGRGPISVDGGLQWLANLLERHGAYLQALAAQGARIDVYCGISSSMGVSSFELPAHCVRLLAGVGAGVFFRLACDPVFGDAGAAEEAGDG